MGRAVFVRVLGKKTLWTLYDSMHFASIQKLEKTIRKKGPSFKFGDVNELGVIVDEGTRISFELAETCWNDALDEDFEEDFEEGKPGDTVVLYIGD